MPNYADLTSVVGRVAVPPKDKPTPKGNVTEFKISETLAYGQGESGKSRLVTVAVWNEQLQNRVADEVSKGQTVACVGTFRKQDGQYADFTAFQVGHVAFIAKSGTGKKYRESDSDANLDF